jgi:hypothetical protein
LGGWARAALTAPGRRGQSTSPVFITCSSSFCEFGRGSFEVQNFAAGCSSDPPSKGVRSSAGGPDRPRGVHVQFAVVKPSGGQARTVCVSRCTSGCSVAFFGSSLRGSWTVRRVFADRPPQLCGPSVWTFAESLSPLLLVFCFLFGIVWGLFVGLVRPLLLRDLGKHVWESLVANLGHRPSSTLGENFYRLPFTPPLWSPNWSFN